ncbi:MAG: hypothetical protein M5U34_01170 [Chloroflexi bacterium]|nr:hypothetical protein [Chloroflexota bacterium]
MALFQGPELPASRVAEIPPIWLSLNMLTAVIALHATDFVNKGWSRVYLFGVLAIFLFGQSLSGANSANSWLIIQLNNLSRALIGGGWIALVTPLNNFSQWLQNDGAASLGTLFGLPFWPFRAIATAVVTGSFNVEQALAPAVLLFIRHLIDYAGRRSVGD